MESAIPAALRCPHPRAAASAPADRQPPYPSFVSRHPAGVTRVVMAYLGVQTAAPGSPDQAGAIEALRHALASADAPSHHDRAGWTDEAGQLNVVHTAYWPDPTAFERWWAAHGQPWLLGATAAAGRYVEILKPPVERFETLFSSPDRAEGVAHLGAHMSGEIREHGYWGGMRDRLPASQQDALEPDGTLTLETQGEHHRVHGSQHLCLIRSGQDWSDTVGEEREMYLRDVEPVLRAGMAFLRDEGRAVGCLTNRYVRVEDAAGRPTDRSHGWSWWRSLADLEAWAASHPTHLAIFGAAMNYLSQLGPAAQLRLYHEVSVVEAGEVQFEYVHCHPATGLLKALAA